MRAITTRQHNLTPLIFLVLAVLLASCGSGGDSSSWSAGPLATPFDLSLLPSPLRILGLGGVIGAPSTVLSGVVYESTPAGNRPMPNTEVRAQSMSGQVTSAVTDSQGRYEIAIVYPINGSPGGLAALQAVRTGYRMPCRPSIAHIAWRDGQPHESHIYLVADRTLVTSGIPAPMPRSSSSLSGTVTEQSSGGTRPVIGARVSAFPTFTETLSDAEGRYLLCGFSEPYGGWFPVIAEDSGEFTSRSGDIRLRADRWSHVDFTVMLNVHSTGTHDIQLTPR